MSFYPFPLREGGWGVRSLEQIEMLPIIIANHP